MFCGAMMDAQYKIIGGDGAEYGPATLAELIGWIRDGRVGAMTQVWRDDLSRWTRADRYQELQAELSRLYTNAAAIAQSRTRPAGFWARLSACLMDRVILLFLFLLVWSPLADRFHWQVYPPDAPTTTDAASWDKYRQDFGGWMDQALPVFLPIFMIYEVLFTGSIGATPGKLAIGARVLAVDGSRLTYARALLRWCAARVTEFLLFAGFLLIAMRPDKRGLHDLLAGTKVVYQR
jgi:uncharacterized RDD family membrane protein YckC